MNWKKIIWSTCKWILKLIGKLLLFALWASCELVAATFTALAKLLKEKVTARNK